MGESSTAASGNLLVRGGTLVSAHEERRLDLRCRGGRIAEIGEALAALSGEATVDAGGAFVFPGGVDPHVHLELDVAATVSADDFASGTAAALAGGTTTVLDFVHPERGEPFFDAVAARRAAAAKALCDHGLHLAVTRWDRAAPEALRRCVDEQGIPSFKLYLAYQATVGLDEHDLVRALDGVAAVGGLALVHAEHGEVIELLREHLAARGALGPASHPRSRPPAAEAEATGRAAALGALLGCPVYVVHVTCAEAVAALAAARARGGDVHGETCPQYLLLDDGVYARPDAAAYVMSPPLRTRDDAAALWDALADGTLEVVATDHCPFTLAQRGAGAGDFRRIPGGVAGIEHRLALLWTHGVVAGRIGRRRFVELVATAPARRFGLWPRKGSLAIGADADLVVWDPAASATISARTHRHRCDHSVYEGFAVTGLPAVVIARGAVAWRDGAPGVEPGAGRYLHRSLAGAAPRVPATVEAVR